MEQVLEQYIGRDCTSIVQHYLNWQRRPFFDELLQKTQTLALLLDEDRFYEASFYSVRDRIYMKPRLNLDGKWAAIFFWCRVEYFLWHTDHSSVARCLCPGRM